MTEDFTKDINKFLKDTQENKVEVLQEETWKSLNKLQENTIKEVKKMNKTIEELKMEIETKKSQEVTTLELENLGKRPAFIAASINSRIQEKEERITDAEVTIENIDTTVKENAKCKMLLIQNIQEIQDTMRMPNGSIIGVGES